MTADPVCEVTVCKGCGQKLKIPASRAGKLSRCPRCHALVDPGLARTTIAQPLSGVAASSDKKFLILICSLSAVIVLGMGTVGFTVWHRQHMEQQAKLDSICGQARSAIQSASTNLKAGQWDAAITCLETAQKELAVSGETASLKNVQNQLYASLQEARKAKQEYRQKVAQGWGIFEGQFISPAEKARILAEREREAKARAEAKAEADRKAREARQRELAEAQERERREVERKAREMYGPYKQAAEQVADNILKMISATETGINYTKHSEMLQELQFTYNKFALARSATERQYSSFQHLTAAVSSFKLAQDWWKLKIEYSSVKGEAELQKAWKEAGDEYAAAMKDLASGK